MGKLGKPEDFHREILKNQKILRRIQQNQRDSVKNTSNQEDFPYKPTAAPGF